MCRVGVHRIVMNRADPKMRRTILLAGVSALLAGAAGPAVGARDAALVRRIASIRRADYRGDRDALVRLSRALAVPAADPWTASRVAYWRGFAHWRRAINGFNESPLPIDLSTDIEAAVAAFEDALSHEPAFLDARIGLVGSMGLQVFLHRDRLARVMDIAARGTRLLRGLLALHPDHPRLLWVAGPSWWGRPVSEGGGPLPAIAEYERGLAIIRGLPPASHPLDPNWGEPELLMSLAWSYLNLPTPAPAVAQRHAEAALALVPDWHYVRDLLLPQLRASR